MALVGRQAERSPSGLELALGFVFVFGWLAVLLLFPATTRISSSSMAALVLGMSLVPALAIGVLMTRQHAAIRHLVNGHYAVLGGVLFPTVFLTVVAGAAGLIPDQISLAALGVMIAGPWAAAQLGASMDARPFGAFRLGLFAWLLAIGLMGGLGPWLVLAAWVLLISLWRLDSHGIQVPVPASSSWGLVGFLTLNAIVLIGPCLVLGGYMATLLTDPEALLEQTAGLGLFPWVEQPELATAQSFWALTGARYATSLISLVGFPILVLAWPKIRPLSAIGQGLAAGLVVLAASAGGHATLSAGGQAFMIQYVALTAACAVFAHHTRFARWRGALLAGAIGATISLGTWAPLPSSIGEAFLCFLADTTYLTIIWLTTYFVAMRALRVDPDSMQSPA